MPGLRGRLVPGARGLAQRLRRGGASKSEIRCRAARYGKGGRGGGRVGGRGGGGKGG